MEPPPVFNISSIAYLQVRNIPRPSTDMTLSQSSGVASTMVLSGITPAFATRMSIRPKRSTAASIMRFASLGTETSPTTVSTSASLPASRSPSSSSPASSTSVRTRSAPSRAKSSAVARPIPFAAPVTTADLPRSRPRPGVTPVSSIDRLLEVLQVPVLVELRFRRLSHELDVAVLQDHRDLRPLHEGAGHHVGVHGGAVYGAEKAFGREVREAGAQGIAVRLVAHAADDDVLCVRALWLLHPQDAEATDNVRVHPRTAVVFAKSVDEQNVHLFYGQGGHIAHVLPEQLLLALADVLGLYGLYLRRLVVGVLDQSQPKEDAPRTQDLLAYLDHVVLDPGYPVAVQLERRGVLAQPDRGHLQETALCRPAKVSVRLDPVDDHDPVGLRGVAVHVHRYPTLRPPYLGDLHGGEDLSLAELLRDTQRLQHLHLPLGRRPAVAPHRRHDERIGTLLLQRTHQRPQDDVYLRNTAAAGRKRNPHSAL